MKKNVNRYGIIIVGLMVLMMLTPKVWAETVEMIDVTVKGQNQSDPIREDTQSGPWTSNPDTKSFTEEMEASFQMMEKMDRKMDDLMQHMMRPIQHPLRSSQGRRPFSMQNQAPSFGQDYSYDETDEKIVLTCQIPNIEKGSLEVTVKSGHVQIKGMTESSEEKHMEGRGGKSYFFSSSKSSFMKNIPLHEAARFENYKVDVQKDQVIIQFERK